MSNMHTADAVFELLHLNVGTNSMGAISYTNSRDQWHRIHGPALIFPSGTKYWYQNGQLHRTDGPAVEYSDGSKFWYQNGQRHRLGGPAVELADGSVEYRIRGATFNRDEFNTARALLSMKFILMLVSTRRTR